MPVVVGIESWDVVISVTGVTGGSNMEVDAVLIVGKSVTLIKVESDNEVDSVPKLESVDGDTSRVGCVPGYEVCDVCTDDPDGNDTTIGSVVVVCADGIDGPDVDTAIGCSIDVVETGKSDAADVTSVMLVELVSGGTEVPVEEVGKADIDDPVVDVVIGDGGGISVVDAVTGFSGIPPVDVIAGET